jgi:PAS domain S-box-containing protein
MNSFDSLDFAQTLFAEVADGLMVVNGDNLHVKEANAAIQALAGASLRELQAMPVTNWLIAESPAEEAEFLTAIGERKRHIVPNGFFVLPAAPTTRIPVSIKVIPTAHHGAAAFLLIVRDLSMGRESEERARRAEAELLLILESVPVAVWSAERHPLASPPTPTEGPSSWRFGFLSHAITQVTGWSSDVFQGGLNVYFDIIHPDDRTSVLTEYTSFLLSPSATFNIEYRVVTPDGMHRWVRSDIHATRTASGQAVRLEGVLSDVSRPKMAELSLRESQQWLSRFLETSTNGILILDLDGRIAFVNRAAELLTGLRSEELLDKDWNDLSWRADSHPGGGHEEVWSRSLWGSEQIIERPDGKQITVALNAAPLRDESGSVTGVVVTLFDVSLRRQAEEALRTEQERLSQIVEAINDGLLLVNASGRVSFANAAVERLFQQPRHELIGRRWNELPWSRDGTWSGDISPDEINKEVLTGSKSLSGAAFLLTRADDTQCTLRGSFFPLRNAQRSTTGMVISLTDETARTEAEKALRSSEERYRRLFQRNLAGVCRIRRDGVVQDCNESYARILGYGSVEEVKQVHAQDWYFDTRERDAKMALLEKFGQLTNHESRLRRKDGQGVWILENITLIRETDGTSMIEATIVDITERKQAEEALAHDHALLRSLINSIPDLIYCKDVNGIYLGCNNAFEAYTGLNEGRILGRRTRDVFPAQRADVMEREEQQVYESRVPLRLENWLEHPSGRRLVELVINPLIDDHGKLLGLLGVGRDITGRRRLEEQVRQTGKMEAIGRLAGGVAHDFNNLLTIILGNLSLTSNRLTSGGSVHELLGDCEKAAQRAAELTSQLLGFARRTPVALEPIDVKSCIAETTQLLKRTIGLGISIETDIDPNLGTVEADRGQIGQVLMNLCINARDAMPRGGKIILVADNVDVTEAQARKNLDARSGSFVRIRVEDTGEGMPPEIQTRIFEPFFTTKPLGQGTGLGLAMVFGIIQQHQGWIECESEPGEGTEFTFYLPRSEKQATQRAPAPVSTEGGTETVLVVDDEPMIRELARAILQHRGYRILTAEDGHVALEMYQNRQRPIDLVLLDLSMPTMSGRETLLHLRVIDPEVNVVFASGYSVDQIDMEQFPEVAGFIPKPYRANDLAAGVRKALDQRRIHRPQTSQATS